MLFIVYTGDELDTSALALTKLDSLAPLGVDLAFARVPYSRREIGAWLLRQKYDPAEEPAASLSRERLERNVRLCVFRMHAEYQVFKQALSLIQGGAIPYVPHTVPGDNLDKYLNEARKWLFSPERFGIDQAGIRELMEDFDTLVTPEENQLLLRQLDKIRPQNLSALRQDLNPRPRPASAEAEFDLFISYNSLDEAEVQPIIEQLRKLGVKVWFDNGGIPHGADVVERLQDGLKRSHGAAVFFGKSGLGTWPQKEVSAIITKYVESRYRIFPIILETATASLEIPEFLRPLRRVDLRNASGDVLRELAIEITGQEAIS
jgi:hypothetical protein